MISYNKYPSTFWSWNIQLQKNLDFSPVLVLPGWIHQNIFKIISQIDKTFVFQGTICVRYVQKHNRRKFEGLVDNTEWPAKDNVVGNLKIPENGNKRDSTKYLELM